MIILHHYSALDLCYVVMLCKYYDFLNLFPAAFQKTFTESDIFSSIESGTKTQTSKNIGNNNHLEEHCNVVNISCVVDISSVKIFTISMLVTSCGSDGVRAGVRLWQCHWSQNVCMC